MGRAAAALGRSATLAPVLASGVLGQLMPLALATVVSPIVFISLFFVLQGSRATFNGLMFVSGLLAAVGVTAVFSAFVLNNKLSNSSSAATSVSWFNLVLGAGELLAGVWLWFKGPRPGHVHPPSILDKLHGAKWFVIVGIGILVPTYPAAISAGTAVARADQSASARGAAVFVYLLLCGLIVGAPVLLLAVRGERGVQQIHDATNWLIQRQSTVGAAVLVIVGAYLIATAF
jgi:hypothetical protein